MAIWSQPVAEDRPTYTAEEVDRAVAALGEAQRFAHAQEIVTHAAPALQRVLDEALDAGGWFGAEHQEHVAKVAREADAEQRLLAVRTLVAEETRLAMLVGVAVGLELGHELTRGREET
jgi:cell division protein ZapA (FtsZ GTPase activity inhibitor)